MNPLQPLLPTATELSPLQLHAILAQVLLITLKPDRQWEQILALVVNHANTPSGEKK